MTLCLSGRAVRWEGYPVGKFLRFGSVGGVRLVGLVVFLAIVGMLAGGCGDTANSPLEQPEQARKGPERTRPETAEQNVPPEPEKPKAERKQQKTEERAKPAFEPVPPPPPEPEPAPAPEPAPVRAVPAYDATATISRVVDGDTVEISPAIGGVIDVRLIGVDTPETKEPGCAPQPYGTEASSYAESALSGQEVGLEFDVEKTDRYGRLLAYVYPASLGGEMFNEDLVEGGYAQAYPYPPNTRYADRFVAAQESASASGLGIWSLGPDGLALLTDRGNGIGGDGCSPLAPEPAPQYEPAPFASADQYSADQPAGGSVPPISESDCPPDYPVKGNASSGIYHVPGGGYYDVTNPEECFATEADAVVGGYRASKV